MIMGTKLIDEVGKDPYYGDIESKALIILDYLEYCVRTPEENYDWDGSKRIKIYRLIIN